MINFIKRNWLLVLLVIVAILLVFYWIQGRSKRTGEGSLPELTKIPYPATFGQEVPPGVSVSLEEISTPQNVTIYQVSPKLFSEAQAKNAASSLGFPSEPSSIAKDAQFGSSYLFLKDSKSLSIRLSPISITLSDDPTIAALPTEGSLPDSNTAVNTLKNILLSASLGGDGLEYKAVGTKEELEGKILRVGFTPTVSGTQVVDSDFINPLVTSFFKRDGALFSFSYRVGFTSPAQPASYPSKNKNEITSSIKKEGRMVILGDQEDAPLAISPTSITLKSLQSVLLYLPDSPTLLYPIYALSGVALTDRGETQVVIYLPAVKSVYVNTARQ